jgi:hypothetical protein
MFGKKKNKSAVIVEVPEFVEVRSYSSTANHIIATNQDEVQSPDTHPALCGYKNWLPTNTILPVTREILQERLPREHSNAFTCPSCVQVITAA